LLAFSLSGGTIAVHQEFNNSRSCIDCLEHF
jgi:hypothetical protein